MIINKVTFYRLYLKSLLNRSQVKMKAKYCT